MSVLLRDKSGRRFLNCEQLKNNNSFTPDTDIKNIPPALRDEVIKLMEQQRVVKQSERKPSPVVKAE